MGTIRVVTEKGGGGLTSVINLKDVKSISMFLIIYFLS